jgi:hypothetical protein
MDFLDPLVEIFLVGLCWSPGGDEDCLRDFGVEKEILSLGLCRLMGKRYGHLELL